MEPWQFTIWPLRVKRVREVTTMLLYVISSPQNEFDVSVVNGINKSTNRNKADENQDHLPSPMQHRKKHLPGHWSAQLVCPKDFPHILQEGKENMAIVLRNLLTDAPRVIVREKITSD